MFRRKKPAAEAQEAGATTLAEAESASVVDTEAAAEVVSEPAAPSETAEAVGADAADAAASGTVETSGNGASTRVGRSGNRVQKVGIVASDKMQKTVVVRVDRLVLHRKYRRYVRRTSKFMAHDELGASTGDRVRIIETRPLSAHKRWRVVEILQKAAK
jgi:small subunit ribosomal protein S17